MGTEVSVSDLLSAIQSGKLNFCMTSATQSNSGCSAYIGFLYALLGNPDVITSESLQTPGLSEQITQLLSGVDRSSGSSDWLKDLFLTGGYDAMVNYECLIISANQELEARGEETLYAVYPYDGLSIADSPLGYVDNGDSEKEQAFLDLQEYLLSDEVQNEIQRTGRRTGYEGVSAENRDVFRADWGIQPDRVLSPIRMPSTDVLMECLNLYQTEFRKPSLTVYCLDYSGSMEGTGREQMVEAMSQILIQENAEQNLLQASEHEVNSLHGLEGTHVHGLDLLIEDLADVGEGKDGNGCGARQSAQAEDVGGDQGGDQGGQGADDAQQQPHSRYDDPAVDDIGGGQHGKGHHQNRANEGAQQGHFDGVKQGLPDLGHIVPLRRDHLPQDHKELPDPADENAHVKTSDLYREGRHGHQNDCRQGRPGAGLGYLFPVGECQQFGREDLVVYAHVGSSCFPW